MVVGQKRRWMPTSSESEVINDKDSFLFSNLLFEGFPTRQTLYHRHIYFGHAFKNQPDWHSKLVPFLRGGGKSISFFSLILIFISFFLCPPGLLYDLEYLTDKEGRRLTSYGPVAGNFFRKSFLIFFLILFFHKV